jgi:oligopeptide/dipeptide ABC transporter ATP-binding protein
MTLLTIRDLRVSLRVGERDREVLRGVDLDLSPGESLGLVGESGSGKSMTARTIARCLPAGAGTRGQVRFAGTEVLDLRGRRLRAYQARDIAMVFQDPRVHLNPVRSIGDFLCEEMRIREHVPRKVAERRAIALLSDVGIDDGHRRLRQYPHELSGGLLQRVMIAAALASEPRLLLADEPTTALDVTTQSGVVAILDELRRERGAALIFITHDLELAGAICDRTAVMYAGEIVEVRCSAELNREPLHPYSAGLLAARPHVHEQVSRLRVIPGQPVAAWDVDAGCPFASRCDYRVDACRVTHPPGLPLGGGTVRCLRAEELSGVVAAPIQGAGRR